LPGSGTADQAAALIIITTLTATIRELNNEKDNVSEQYAILNVDDSTMRLESLAYETKKIAELLKTKKAESEWEIKMVASYLVDSTDATKEEAGMAAALESWTASSTLVTTMAIEIATMQARQVELAAETKDMTKVQEEATTYLAEAEEARAAAQMAVQTAEFDAFKVFYNEGKSQYDALAEKDDLGTASDADYTLMASLEATYFANQAKFDDFEADRLQKEREQLEKGYNKEKMAAERMRAEVATLQAAATAAAAFNVTATEGKAAATAKITKL